MQWLANQICRFCVCYVVCCILIWQFQSSFFKGANSRTTHWNILHSWQFANLGHTFESHFCVSGTTIPFICLFLFGGDLVVWWYTLQNSSKTQKIWFYKKYQFLQKFKLGLYSSYQKFESEVIFQLEISRILITISLKKYLLVSNILIYVCGSRVAPPAI